VNTQYDPKTDAVVYDSPATVLVTRHGPQIRHFQRRHIVADNLTAYARTGFDGNPNPHLWSSPAWLAHALGRYLHDSGRSVPTDVRMGRGDSIRCKEARTRANCPR
jgi:hypothetical protein